MKTDRLLVLGFVFFFLLLSCRAESGPGGRSAERPLFEAELLFPPEPVHNHSSSIVECSNGSLLVCWYRGSGERTADDVAVLGSRKEKNQKNWSRPFRMADTPRYPDTNPILFIDPQKKLWLIYSTVLDNQWQSALLKYKTSTNYLRPGPPLWSDGDLIHVTPDAAFAPQVERAAAAMADSLPSPKLKAELEGIRKRASNKLYQRIGWMPRVHMLALGPRHWILPLYSDGFDFSIMAITTDGGSTWEAGGPMIGMGNVQPSLVRKKDGTLAAYMRDNGPPPNRIPCSESKDEGRTWSEVRDLPIPNSGASIEIVSLRSGAWALAYNDLEEGRYRLAVALSEDEGRTWPWKRYVERDPTPAEDPKAFRGSYHYPSLLEASDGSIHLTYSYYPKEGQTIKHARFNEAWIRQAGRPDPSPK